MGARFSDDSRVYEDGVLGSSGQEDRRGEPRVEQSVGWKWIRQIQLVRQTFTEPPSIYEIQTYAVYVLFVQATTTPESCWILVSIGVRFAQDVGAHRKKPENTKVTVRNELWKRVSWMLYVMDMFTSAYLGRPRSIAREDFDVEFPVDYDDEYWEENPDDPNGGGVDGHIILALAMRTIYAVRKSDMWTSMGQSALEWTEKMVAELDSSLNKWVEEVPEHPISHSHHGKRLADSGKLSAKRSSTTTMDTSSEGKGNEWSLSQMPLESPSQPQPPPQPPGMTSSTSDGFFNVLPTHKSPSHVPIAESFSAFSDWTTMDNLNQPEWLLNIITGLLPPSFNFRPDLDEVHGHGHDGVIGLGSGSGAETTGLVPSPPDMEFSGGMQEGTIIPVNGDGNHSAATTNSEMMDEWSLYMASVDEILQNLLY
ncbi:hypothetical protein D9757_008601 [Collybiopsis confluens]|uniref:Xylanolytic transcriptional activator regulatory domain-containing protein n=1 Tax=Collybiopsis confluens TaxID=2823264 RepID=A0A8H5HMU9_9AGAR|nr:hypothetical protein D9757_008601 [Collybiopsis confluens]